MANAEYGSPEKPQEIKLATVFLNEYIQDKIDIRKQVEADPISYFADSPDVEVEVQAKEMLEYTTDQIRLTSDVLSLVNTDAQLNKRQRDYLDDLFDSWADVDVHAKNNSDTKPIIYTDILIVATYINSCRG